MVLKDGRAMSKSHGNVVGAMEMAEQYGADVGRLYTLFATQPERDLEWSEESIEGSCRFLSRVYRLAERHPQAVPGGKNGNAGHAQASPEEKILLPTGHPAPPAVARDFENRWPLH